MWLLQFQPTAVQDRAVAAGEKQWQPGKAQLDQLLEWSLSRNPQE
jgi:hypothetical protein